MKIKKFNESFLGGDSQNNKREFDINNKNRGKYFDRYYENLENDLLNIYNKVRNNEKLSLMDIKEMMVSFEEHIELNWGEEARKNNIQIMKIKKFNESNNIVQDELKEKFQGLIDDYSEELTATEFSSAIVEVLEMFYYKHRPKSIDDIDKEDTYAKRLLMSMRSRIEL